jgi:uncharacterized protein (TIGR02996 family)
MAKRYFEFSEGSSNKFWEVWVDGTKVLTRYGKIGAAGQTTVKDEGSPAGAQKLHDKLVGEKTKKGYAEKGGAPAAAAPAAAKPAAAPKKAAPAPAPAPAKGPAVVEEGFRRFEFVEGGSSKFWEVKVEESEQIVRFGKIGTAGQEKTKEFDGPGEAKADTKKLIAEKTGKGYVEVGGKPKPKSNPQLEAAIAKNPDDATAYLVYADWLQSQGDAFGEFIVMSQKDPKGALKKHKKHVLGSLAEWPAKGEKSLEIEWQHGFMKDVKMGWGTFDEEGEEATSQATDEFAELLDLPAARFIQHLRLGPFPPNDDYELNMQAWVDVLAEKKAPASLRSLYLGEVGDWDISNTNSGKFAPLAAVFTKLEKLTLHGGHHNFGKNVSLPELKELNLESGGLGKDVIKDAMAAKLPKLERLNIWFGSDNYGGNITLKDLGPILSGVAFPHLKHLGLMNCSFVGDIVKELIRSKVLPKITSLDLSMGCLGDADIDAMVAAAASFKHLTDLNVEDSALTNASKPKLKVLAKNVNFGKRQSPDRLGEYRYVSVSE